MSGNSYARQPPAKSEQQGKSDTAKLQTKSWVDQGLEEQTKGSSATCSNKDLPMSEASRQKLRQYRVAIMESLNVSDIVDDLIKNEAITTNDDEVIKSKQTTHEAAESLLDLLPRRGERAFAVFCQALGKDYPFMLKMLLRSTDAIDRPGNMQGCSAECSNKDMLMTDASRRKLIDNRVAIVDNLDVRDIVSELIQNKAITPNDNGVIKSKQTIPEAAECLLDLLPRRGERAFAVFGQSLSEVYPFLLDMLKSPPTDSHFLIVSRFNQLVLTVDGASNAPGTRVIMQPRNSVKNVGHQMWYEDRTTRTVNNCITDLSLDIAAGKILVVNPYIPERADQQWRLVGERVENYVNSSTCLAIAAANRSPGAMVCASEWDAKVHQKWDFEVINLLRAPPAQLNVVQPAMPRRYFFIHSFLNWKTMDIEENSCAPGTQVIMCPRKPGQPINQLWYQDDNGIIRSKMNDFAFDGSRGEIKMQPYQPQNRWQQWTINGRLIQNKVIAKRVLDVDLYNKADGAKVIRWSHHGGQNQLWDFDYV